MTRTFVLLCCALGVALAACVKTGEPTPGKSTHEATAAAAAPPANTAGPASGTASSSTDGVAAPSSEAPPKPAACHEDKDCGPSKVCESCGPEGKCCTLGCHEDSQCGQGRRCHQVQCIRAPCPGQCE